MKYEYACFTLCLTFNAPTKPREWPDPAVVDEQIVQMNKLGAEGWEIFARHWGPYEQQPGNPTDPSVALEYPATKRLNLWARRRAV